MMERAREIAEAFADYFGLTSWSEEIRANPHWVYLGKRRWFTPSWIALAAISAALGFGAGAWLHWLRAPWPWIALMALHARIIAAGLAAGRTHDEMTSAPGGAMLEQTMLAPLKREEITLGLALRGWVGARRWAALLSAFLAGATCAFGPGWLALAVVEAAHYPLMQIWASRLTAERLLSGKAGVVQPTRSALIAAVVYPATFDLAVALLIVPTLIASIFTLEALGALALGTGDWAAGIDPWLGVRLGLWSIALFHAFGLPLVAVKEMRQQHRARREED